MSTYTSRVKRVFEVSLNFKSAGTTIIIPPLSGRKFIPDSAWAIQDTRTGSGSDPTFTIQVSGAPFLLVDLNQSIPTATYGIGEKVPFVLNGSSNIQKQDLGTNGLAVTITAASTFTTHTGTIYVAGYLVDP